MRLILRRRDSAPEGFIVIRVALGSTYVQEIATVNRVGGREAAIHRFVRIIEEAERFGETGLAAHVKQLQITKSPIDFYYWPTWDCTLTTTLTPEEYEHKRDSRIRRLRERGVIKDPSTYRGFLARRDTAGTRSTP